MITQKMVLHLIRVLEAKGETERAKPYWNAYYCQNNLVISNGKTYGKYCKTRFCTVCLSIRKAKIMNDYLPTISEWKDTHFVTLTVKAVKENKLSFMIDKVMDTFRKIREKHKKRDQRETGEKLIGVRSLECNFNPKEKTYNPHLHIIVPSKRIAKLLVKEWLASYDEKSFRVIRSAQHFTKVNNLEKSLIEIVKYGSKIFTEPDLKKKGDSNIPLTIYAAALDNIFCAMKGRRLFDRFGFNLPKKKAKKKKIQTILKYDNLVYHPKQNDWLNVDTGELTSGYEPAPSLRFLLGTINTDLE